MSAGNIDTLLNLWASTLFKYDDHPPFHDHKDLYDTIDATPLGDVPWESFSMSYNGERPDDPEDVPAWMNDEFQVWYRDPRTVVRNMLSNPDFDGEIDYAPFRQFGDEDERQYQDFMSGDWAWRHAVGR
jgi:Plavaka transposase